MKMYCLTIYDNHYEKINKIGYTPVGLGKNISSPKFLLDSKGENISYKNPFYGEYSFHYWLWKNEIKNLKEENWIGFCQYRKFWSNTEEKIKFDNINKLNQNLVKTIPKELDKFDLFIFHGGKQSANSKSKAIAYEYKFLKYIIKLNKPIIGICLGAQLIAKIYGSKISKSKNKVFECGYKKNLKNNSKVFKKNLSFLQFHTEGISLNKNMVLLAKGIMYDVDSFKIKNKIFMVFNFILKLQLIL